MISLYLIIVISLDLIDPFISNGLSSYIATIHKNAPLVLYKDNISADNNLAGREIHNRYPFTPSTYPKNMHFLDFEFSFATCLIKTIAEVVEGCHSLRVMHRYLRPDNFLFVSKDEDAALKVIDFGMSVFYMPGDAFCDWNSVYAAPEVSLEHYGPEAEIWSVGKILHLLLIICAGTVKFDAGDEASSLIIQKNVDFESEPWPSISDGAKDYLLLNMLNPDPTKRFTAHQVLCHRWIVGDGVTPEKPLDSAVLSRLKRFSAMKKLKKMALRFIGEKMSDEETGGLKKLFKMFDTYKSGTITCDELNKGLRKLGSDLMESEVQTLMQGADIDNNGTVDCREFLSAMLHVNKLEKEENLRNAFSFFDEDKNGYITIDDLSQACKDFGVRDVNLDEMIKEVDQNNDGKIDYSEFETLMRKGNGGNGALARRTKQESLNVEEFRIQ
ncbi:LOW QUALITY PROTEIN: calcium-dependent protein kinase 28-like [Asparagus officinalis]|uniref:LOW QUALITY PROTEIN: calcium-dependent protein kinase 28-like n=1 Tax=Asparagus officinalis TaxID=4686 RepID=UPI00098E7D06|nr:LOW QUALITY PROTEIN: calcium-dependent protein kinase 28-like [Asparagus officinalis]